MSQTELDVVVEERTSSGNLGRAAHVLGWLALALPVLTVVLVYVLLRWAPSPIETALVVGGLLLIALTVAGYLGVRRGVVAPFVAAALILPYLVAGAALLGTASRVSSELEGWIGDESSDSTADDLSDSDADEEDFEDGEETGGFEGEGAAQPSYEELAFAAGTTGYFEGFAVTIDSLECGVESVANAAENPEYWESDDAPQYIAATPEEGKSFCVVQSTWMNESQRPQSRATYETLTGLIDAEGNQYAKSEDDEAFSEAVTEQNGYEGSELNPGDTAKVTSVFSLPTDTEISYLVADGYAFDSEELAYFKAP